MKRERAAEPSTLLRAALLLAGLRLLLQLALRAAFDGWSFPLTPTEIARTAAAVSFAAEPAFAPDGILHWLPLPFWLTGSLLRVWPDPLLVPFLLNTLFSLLAVAGLTLWAGGLAGSGAGVAAGLAGALSGASLALGIGATADPLLHAALVWSLLFWSRFERGGRLGDAWASSACLALACAARYEAWCVLAALCLEAALSRRRAALLPLAAACAVPAVWLGYNASATGDPWTFAKVSFEADVRNANASGFMRGVYYLLESLEDVPAWTLALAGAAAAGAARLPRSYWLSAGALAAFFALTQPFNAFSVDLHQTTVFLLLLPAAGAAAASALAAASPARRRLAVAGAALLLALASTPRAFSAYIVYQRRLKSVARPYLAVRELKRAGALGPDDAVLVELPADGRLIAHYRVWSLEPRLNASLDRPFPPNDVSGAYPEPDGPSPLDQAPAKLGPWLSSRRIRLVVASRRTASLAALGWRDGGGGLWRPSPL